MGRLCAACFVCAACLMLSDGAIEYCFWLRGARTAATAFEIRTSPVFTTFGRKLVVTVGATRQMSARNGRASALPLHAPRDCPFFLTQLSQTSSPEHRIVPLGRANLPTYPEAVIFRIAASGRKAPTYMYPRLAPSLGARSHVSVLFRRPTQPHNNPRHFWATEAV
jgi:hypothetical protein